MILELRLYMCSTTGKAYVYNNTDKLYITLSDYTIPEEFRYLCNLRGNQYHAYIQTIETYDNSSDLGTFLYKFPDWNSVKNFLSYDTENSWTEDDHTTFKAAIEYLAQRPGYTFSWSY